MDRVERAVQGAIDAATFDIDAPDIDGVSTRVRFEPESLKRVTELHRDPRTRLGVLDLVDEAVSRGIATASELNAGGVPIRENAGWRTATVAVQLRARLDGVRDRRYVEQADGTIALASEKDLGPEYY